MKFRLAGEDRERLGAPEWLEVDVSRLMLREAIEVQQVMDLTPEELVTRALAFDPRALAAVVWIALRRAGVEVKLADLDFDLVGMTVDVGEGKEEDGGNGSPEKPTSTD